MKNRTSNGNINRRESFTKLAGLVGFGALSASSFNVALAADSNNQDSNQADINQNANQNTSKDAGTNQIEIIQPPSKQDLINSQYADSDKMVLPKEQMKLKKDVIGIVIVNPQVDFLSPKGVGWNVYGASIKEQNAIENITMLLRVSKARGIPLFISYFVWNKYDSLPHTPMKNFMRGTSLAFSKKSGLDANNISNSGADFLENYKNFIFDDKTILATPRKDFGLKGCDLAAKLRVNGVKQVILCGMDANTHLDSHLRDLLSEGFEVGVVRDGTAGAKLPEGDGYLAALINFRYLANQVFYTNEIVVKLQRL